MRQHKFIYTVFIIASIFFVAKPFIGFRIKRQLRLGSSKTVLVKAFSKRKPDTLEEAEKKSKAISNNLINPPLKETALLALLLSLLLPVITPVKEFIANGVNIFYTKPPVNLLTCKLSI